VADATTQNAKRSRVGRPFERESAGACCTNLVSRNLARLQAQGFISINGREVTIVDEADLSSTV